MHQFSPDLGALRRAGDEAAWPSIKDVPLQPESPAQYWPMWPSWSGTGKRVFKRTDEKSLRHAGAFPCFVAGQLSNGKPGVPTASHPVVLLRSIIRPPDLGRPSNGFTDSFVDLTREQRILFIGEMALNAD